MILLVSELVCVKYKIVLSEDDLVGDWVKKLKSKINACSKAVDPYKILGIALPRDVSLLEKNRLHNYATSKGYLFTEFTITGIKSS